MNEQRKNVPSVIDILPTLQKSFITQNTYGLKFESECLFARQQLIKNDYTVSTAQNNPNSLKSAILNVAAIGISLNPAVAHAYLVPRDGSICLDVSYRGLVKLATDSGAIEWAKAVLVYENDTFEMNGVWGPPLHKCNPFSKDRGPLIGGYCLAKLSTGDKDYMVDVMTFEEMEKIRQTSKAKKGPWLTWPDEMRKKTLIKRASKSWPQSNGRDRLDEAVQILNEHEGIEEVREYGAADFLRPSKEQTETYLQLSQADPVEFFLWWNAQDEKLKPQLPGIEFKRGEKIKTMESFNASLNAGREKFQEMQFDLVASCEKGDETGVLEVIEGLPESQIKALAEVLNIEQASFYQATINELEGMVER